MVQLSFSYWSPCNWMTVFSVGVLPRLGLEPRTIGQQPNALTVRPFYAPSSEALLRIRRAWVQCNCSFSHKLIYMIFSIMGWCPIFEIYKCGHLHFGEKFKQRNHTTGLIDTAEKEVDIDTAKVWHLYVKKKTIKKGINHM